MNNYYILNREYIIKKNLEYYYKNKEMINQRNKHFFFITIVRTKKILLNAFKTIIIVKYML